MESFSTFAFPCADNMYSEGNAVWYIWSLGATWFCVGQACRSLWELCRSLREITATIQKPPEIIRTHQQASTNYHQASGSTVQLLTHSPSKGKWGGGGGGHPFLAYRWEKQIYPGASTSKMS